MGWDNPLVGGVVLRRAAIQSPDFVTGVSGWTVNQDGSAEFNDLVLRGTFNGTDFEINSLGAFFYNGTPAHGNLIASIASAAGTDGFTNSYLRGVVEYNPANSTFVQMDGGQLNFGFTSQGDPGQLSLFAAGIANLISPDTGGVGDVQALLYAFSKQSLTFGSVTGIQGFASDPLYAFNPAAPRNTPEIWHSFGALQNTWARVTGESEPSFRLAASPPNTVEVAGTATVTVGANTANGTVIAGPLAGAYRPPNRQPVFVTVRGQTAATNNAQGLAVTTRGNLVVETIGGAAGDVLTVRFHGFISLDLPTH
jgi:hypothetical protein